MDLIRPIRRATLIRLKSDSGVTALVPASSIHPSTTPTTVAWPFIRWDGPSSVPVTGGRLEGATVTFLLHAFARPRVVGGAVAETAEDFASRIGAAMTGALHQHRLPLEAPLSHASARITVQSSRSFPDRDEQDAWHVVLSCEARALVAC